MLAAERTGRRCYGVEIDPLYVDVAIRRWQRYTGERAIHQSGQYFDDLAREAESLELSTISTDVPVTRRHRRRS